MASETRAPAGEKGTADRVEADDGMFWVRLVTRQALDREGAAMRHCVGDGDYDVLVGGEDLADDSIWSLRRSDGSSALTVRVRHGELDYARGFSNHGPGKGACLQVRHLAAAFAGAGHRLAVDEDTGIVLLDDGRTFRRDRLPPEVVAVREAAQREMSRRMREARSVMRVVRDEYAVRGAQVFFAPRAPDATFHRIGDIEIRTDERPDLAIIGAGISHGPVHPIMELTAREADPVVEAWVLFHLDGQGFRTRSGIRFDVPARSLIGAGIERQNTVILEAYRAAIARAGETSAPSAVDLLLRNAVHHRVGVHDILQLTLPNGESAFDVRNVVVLSGEDVAVPPERYVVDARLGTIRFLDNHACLEVRFIARERAAPVQMASGAQPAVAFLPWSEETITSPVVEIEPAHEQAAPPEPTRFQVCGTVAVKAELARLSTVLTARAEGRPS